MELLPWWVYIVVAGIVISGFMVIFTEKQEQEEDNEFIEREGEKYIQRMKNEKEERFNNEKKSKVGI